MLLSVFDWVCSLLRIVLRIELFLYTTICFGFFLFIARVYTLGLYMAKTEISIQTTIYFRRTDMQFSFHKRPVIFGGWNMKETLATVLFPALRWESEGTQGCVYQAAVIKYSFYYTINSFKLYSFWHLHMTALLLGFSHTHSSSRIPAIRISSRS
jgi:hypothetical protein